ADRHRSRRRRNGRTTARGGRSRRSRRRRRRSTTRSPRRLARSDITTRMKTVVHSDEAPKAIGPYSQAIKAGNLLFCSGQIPLDPKTGEMVGASDVRAQARQVMANL